MSFILDALRKSEHARASRLLPGVRERATLERRPRWLAGLLVSIGVLLIVNLVLLVYMLGRGAPANTSAPPIGVANMAVRPTTTRSGTVRPLSGESAELAAPVEGNVTPRAAPTVGKPMPAAARSVNAATTGLGLPSIRQLPPQATAGLPELNMELHVFATDPGQRFVFINGQRLQEGGATREGVAVEAITPTGVILRYQGTRFTLP